MKECRRWKSLSFWMMQTSSCTAAWGKCLLKTGLLVDFKPTFSLTLRSTGQTCSLFTRYNLWCWQKSDIFSSNQVNQHFFHSIKMVCNMFTQYINWVPSIGCGVLGSFVLRSVTCETVSFSWFWKQLLAKSLSWTTKPHFG